MKRKDQRIARAVLAGLAAGSMTGVLGIGDASAMTLDEYKQALAEGKVLVVDTEDERRAKENRNPLHTSVAELNEKGIRQVRSVEEAWLFFDLKDGDKPNAMELRPSDKRIAADGTVTQTKEGGAIAFAYGIDFEKIQKGDPNGVQIQVLSLI